MVHEVLYHAARVSLTTPLYMSAAASCSRVPEAMAEEAELEEAADCCSKHHGGAISQASRCQVDVNEKDLYKIFGATGICRKACQASGALQ